MQVKVQESSVYSDGQADLYSEPPERILDEDSIHMPSRGRIKASGRGRPAATVENIVTVYSPELDSECDELLTRAKTVAEALRVLPRLKFLAESFPDELKPNLNYISVWELTRRKAGLFDAWCALHQRFPHCDKALRFRVRWLKRMSRDAEGHALIEEYLPGIPETYTELQQKAELLNELKNHAATRECFERMVSKFPDDPRPRFHFAKWLQDNGQAEEAWRVFEPATGSSRMPAAGITFGKKLRAGLDVLRAFKSELNLQEMDTTLLALAYAIEQIAKTRMSAPRSETLGKVSFITGSLGPGGAERQIARTVARFEAARRAGATVADIDLDDEFHVVVKTLDGAAGHDFFVSMLSDKGGKIFQVDDMPPIPYDKLDIADPVVKSLLTFLPPSVAYGVQRMVTYFRKEKIRVAYIWQDGAVLFATLAALIVGVPRIILSMRGLPPNLRLHMQRREYFPMYKALAAVPGVDFASNNRVIGNAYCDWIGMDPKRFHVIYNGIDFLFPHGRAEEQSRWQAFVRDTGGADAATIGGVFRFDTDKRPLLWIDFACAYLHRNPSARFVLVGGGKMLKDARLIAENYGIADRILFTGLSSHVGYWISKMDVFVLLSRFEGLPNVVVEAQLNGVPVVATPAGGTAEAVQDGVAGRILLANDPVDLDELCGKVDEVMSWQASDPSLGMRLSAGASVKFSTKKMVERTAMLLAGQLEDYHE